MGIDLTVYPFSYPYSESEWWLGYDRLSLRRNYKLFNFLGLDIEEIEYSKVVETHKVPDSTSFDIYRDDGLERGIKEDAYGNKLEYIYVEELNKIPKGIIEELSDWNKAVFNMLTSLKDSDIIVLYWN